MSYTNKVINILYNEGPISLVRKGVPFLYDQHIAKYLPPATASHNGVTVESAKIFDSKLPWREPNRPNVESGLVSHILEHVEEGDKVVIVGGGWGVTATKAAQKVGETGNVIVYEGSLEEVNKLEKTIDLNDVADIVDIRHCIVGPAVYLRGKPENAEIIHPSDLPECDILELDCEGAENEILLKIDIEPRAILVETHGKYDSPSQLIENLLEDLGYQIDSKIVAEERKAEYCRNQDIYAISAIRNV